MTEEAKRRGLCPKEGEIRILGDDINSFRVKDYLHSDAKRGKIFSLLPPFLQPKPDVILSKCVGCGKCAESCPAHVIRIENRGKAVIDRKGCIKCFCCQELCPIHAVDIKKNIIFKLIR